MRELGPRPVRKSRAGFVPLFAAAMLCVTSAVHAQSPDAGTFAIGDLFDVRNVNVGDVSADGRWAVVTIASLRDRMGGDNYRYGDPTYIAPSTAEVVVIDTRTAESRPLFTDRRQTRAFAWSPDAAKLAFLLREGDRYRLAVWERAPGRLQLATLPANRTVASNASPQWTDDGTGLFVQLQAAEWWDSAGARFEREVNGPIVVRSSEDPFLSWEEIRRLGLRVVPALYDVESGSIRELGPESLIGNAELAGESLRLERDITKETSYERIFGRDSRVELMPLSGGEPRVILPSTEGLDLVWSRNGEAYAYAKEGKLYFARTDGGEPRLLAGIEEEPDSADAPADSAADRRRRARERFTPIRLSEDGGTLIASNRDGLWFFDTAAATRELFHRTRPEGAAEAEDEDDDDRSPRWSVAAWSRDGNDVYLTYASRTEWERGIHRYERDTKQLRQLVRDGRMYSDFELSDDGTTVVLAIADGNRPADVHVADRDLTRVRRLTDANPQLREKRLGRSELIEYLDVDGQTLNGVVYYPPDYEAGRRYPTVFIVYETFFDDRFNATVALLNANGYVVVQPSVDLEIGYPGEAWVKGVTAAANALVERGVADPDRLGVHGTSYGGYATNLLITQTPRFAAAINISGKVDMISFYTDSPRLGVRNIHAPENSQDRIGATLWEQPHKYIAHSAIMFADRIETPLLLMTGAQDHNVPERTTMEMFYALRRLGKTVEWVSYIDGGHGMPTTTEAEVLDYHRRILGWYEKHLKNDGKEGVADR